MADRNTRVEEITSTLRDYQAKKMISAFSVKEEGDRLKVWLNTVRPREREVMRFCREQGALVDPLSQEYHLFGGELRPGAGIIRVFGGRSEGPSGTLTCLLSSKDGRDLYFAAAGHVVSNFWMDKAPDPTGSIYQYRRGFPSSNSSKSLGKLCYLCDKPMPINDDQPDDYDPGSVASIDMGIVKLQADDLALKQRTTCYGGFGEWPPAVAAQATKGMGVMKCGAEETHWTTAVVEHESVEVPVYGPRGCLYRFTNQVIIQLDSRESSAPRSPEGEPPNNLPGTPFAVPGDSGTMVVEKESKRPLGMLIAGSVLDGSYVMTPFAMLRKYWEEKDLVLLRG